MLLTVFSQLSIATLNGKSYNFFGVIITSKMFDDLMPAAIRVIMMFLLIIVFLGIELNRSYMIEIDETTGQITVSPAMKSKLVKYYGSKNMIGYKKESFLGIMETIKLYDINNKIWLMPALWKGKKSAQLLDALKNYSHLNELNETHSVSTTNASAVPQNTSTPHIQSTLGPRDLYEAYKQIKSPFMKNFVKIFFIIGILWMMYIAFGLLMMSINGVGF